MNIEQLLKLIEAGYTKAEIEAMTKGTPASEETEAPASEETEATASEETEATASDETEATASDETTNQFMTLSQELENIKKMIQKSNIINKGNDEKPKTETASDILAKLIDPKLNGGN